MNHSTMFLNSPMMWVGAVTFRSNRIDIYESLLAKLDGAGRSAVQSIPEIFGEWATREKRRGETLGFVYDYVQRKTSTGSSVADALRPFVDSDEYLILAGGETRGDLVTALRSLTNNIQARQAMRDAVMASMLMPALGLMSIVLLSIAFGLSLWPEFVRAIPINYWPTWSRPCIEVQLWMGRHWPWFGIILIAIWGYFVSVSRWTGRVRNLVDHLPPWSINKGRLAANTLAVLAALVNSGMSVREAFVMVRDRADPYLRWHMAWIIRRYDSNGKDGIAALRTSLFSRRIMDRVEDAAAGRSFDETLRDVGIRSMSLVVRSLKAQAQASSGVVFMLVGVVFVYVTIVMVFGIQDATDAYSKAMGGGGPLP